MKKLLLLALLLPLFSFAQNGGMTGIDAHFNEDGFYDNVKDALANKNQAFYLDLSLQSPKLDVIPDEVFELVHLKSLEVGFNRLSKINAKIGLLTEIENLGFQGNKYLTTVPLEFSKLPNLKEINVKDTGLSAEQIELIRKAIPKDCKLIY